MYAPGPSSPEPRRCRARRPGIALAVVVLLVGACTGSPRPAPGHTSAGATAAGSGAPSGARPSSGTRPNIVLILTDDQRWDELGGMPTVQRDLVQRGVTFTNSFVVNPACCPSRTSILTGDYSHTTGIYKNNPPHGGFDDFEDSRTVATWLHGAGYRTGLIGKYVNGYSTARVGYIPPGWDVWNAFTLADANSGDGKGGYFDYAMTLNGTARAFGAAPKDYSTDVLAGFAVQFIRGAAENRPLFLYFAPRAPHAPSTPPPRYAAACRDLRPRRPPSFNERDVSDKPEYVKSRPPVDAAAADTLQRRHCQALLGVDDAVKSIVGALQETGRLSNTMIAFASDNGVEGGEHRLRDKYVPYEESIRVPLVVRDDALVKVPRRDAHLVLNIDYAPTFAAVAGVQAPGSEGRSLLPLLMGPAAGWRTDFLVEHAGAVAPAFCAVRTERYMYVAYETGERELYDLRSDPYELDNRADDPALGSTLRALRGRNAALCRPVPPGFKVRP